MALSAGQLPREIHTRLTSDNHHVQNDEVRWTPRQLHLLAIVQAQRFSLFGHTTRMPDETDTKKILTASSLENWRRPPGCPILRG